MPSSGALLITLCLHCRHNDKDDEEQCLQTMMQRKRQGRTFSCCARGRRRRLLRQLDAGSVNRCAGDEERCAGDTFILTQFINQGASSSKLLMSALSA